MSPEELVEESITRIERHNPTLNAVIHRSPENRSGAPRRAVVFEVRAADALQLAGDVWVDTGLVLRGAATSQVRCENLCTELPRRRGADFPYGSAWNQEGGYARGLNFRTEHTGVGATDPADAPRTLLEDAR